MSMAIIGAAFVDIKGFASKDYVPEGRNIGDVRFIHGGVCRNVCEDFANQKQPSMFVSMVDSSGIGAEVYKRLYNKGVDMQHTIQCENGLGLWLVILDEHGNLAGSISNQPDFSALEAYIDKNADTILADCDGVVLEIDMNAAIAAKVLETAAKYGKDVFAIVGNMGVILAHPEYLQQVHCFICNEFEAERLFKDVADPSIRISALEPADMRTFLKTHIHLKGIERMVVTMGANGCAYCDSASGEEGLCPAIPSMLVDSSGAGDAFFAGTVMALTRGLPLQRAVRIGTTMASRTISYAESVCPEIEGLFSIK